MMRKTSLIFLGAIAGAGLTLLATQPHSVFVGSGVVESAINGMLGGLDPHSSYMDPSSFRDIQVQTRGEFGGLGMEVTMEDGLGKVGAPIDETPAAKAGGMATELI